MSISINQIVNANVYTNGVSQMGRANEVKITDIEFEKIEHKGLGLHGAWGGGAGDTGLGTNR